MTFRLAAPGLFAALAFALALPTVPAQANPAETLKRLFTPEDDRGWTSSVTQKGCQFDLRTEGPLEPSPLTEGGPGWALITLRADLAAYDLNAMRIVPRRGGKGAALVAQRRATDDRQREAARRFLAEGMKRLPAEKRPKDPEALLAQLDRRGGVLRLNFSVVEVRDKDGNVKVLHREDAPVFQQGLMALIALPAPMSFSGSAIWRAEAPRAEDLFSGGVKYGAPMVINLPEEAAAREMKSAFLTYAQAHCPAALR